MPKGLSLHFNLRVTVGPTDLAPFPHLQDTVVVGGISEVTDQEILNYLDEYIRMLTKKKPQFLHAIKRHITY